MSSPTTTTIVQAHFCENADCVLHVTGGDPGVSGSGDWASVDGRTVSRRHVGLNMYCDDCATRADRNSGANGEHAAEAANRNVDESDCRAGVDPVDTATLERKRLEHAQRMITLLQDELSDKASNAKESQNS